MAGAIEYDRSVDSESYKPDSISVVFLLVFQLVFFAKPRNVAGHQLSSRRFSRIDGGSHLSICGEQRARKLMQE